MSRDPVTRAVFQMVDEAGAVQAFSVELGRALGWSMEADACVRRVRQYRNEQMYRHLPACAIPIAIRVSCRDYVTPLLQRALIRAEDEAEQQRLERPTVRPVRRAGRGERRSA